MEYIIKVIEFVIELFEIGVPLAFIVIGIMFPFMYYQHYLDCKKYPDMYTMRLWGSDDETNS